MADKRDLLSKNFKELFILIISILHGQIFFLISEKATNLMGNFSIKELSLVILFYSMFFRVFQTHILAALRYQLKWNVKVFEFILVFLTALFEVFLVRSSMLKSAYPFHILLIIFSLFGIFGYFLSYKQYSKVNNKYLLAFEKKLQTINILILLFILLLSVSSMLLQNFYFSIGVNFLTGILLLINIYFSLSISKKTNYK